MSPITCSLSAVDGGALLLLLGTQLEGLAAPQVLHLERRALLALHLERDFLRHLPNHVESDSAHEASANAHHSPHISLLVVKHAGQLRVLGFSRQRHTSMILCLAPRISTLCLAPRVTPIPLHPPSYSNSDPFSPKLKTHTIQMTLGWQIQRTSSSHRNRTGNRAA